MALEPIAELNRQIEAAASDPELTPRERMVKLRDLRERIADCVGIADRHLNGVQRVREAEAAEEARAGLRTRDLADLRDGLEEAGLDLDGLALPSHRDLDELAEEGLLAEAVPVLDRHPMSIKFDPLKHPHGMGGRFSDTAHEDAPRAMHDMHGNEIDQRYRDYFKDDPEAVVAHVSRLRPTRSDPPEHVAKARRNLRNAKRGLIGKRKPLDVIENGDGSLSVIDGNSTLEALKGEGLTHLPVKVNHDAAGGADEAARARVADELASKAEEAEKDVTPAIRNVVEAAGGSMDGLEYRLKTRESIKSKLARKQEKYPGMEPNQAAEKVKDALRYTAVVPSDSYVDTVKSVQQKLGGIGYGAQETRNYWGGGDDYDGFHTIMHGPNGTFVELQFHTPESLAAKQKVHPMFEKFRDSKDSSERYKLWQRMVAVMAKTPPPPGIEKLGPGAASPSLKQRVMRHEAPEFEGKK